MYYGIYHLDIRVSICLYLLYKFKFCLVDFPLQQCAAAQLTHLFSFVSTTLALHFVDAFSFLQFSSTTTCTVKTCGCWGACVAQSIEYLTLDLS